MSIPGTPERADAAYQPVGAGEERQRCQDQRSASTLPRSERGREGADKMAEVQDARLLVAGGGTGWVCVVADASAVGEDAQTRIILNITIEESERVVLLHPQKE